MEAFFIPVLLFVFAANGRPCHAASIEWGAFWESARATSPRTQLFKTRTEQAQAAVALEVPPPMVAVGSMGMNGPLNGVMEQTFEVTQRLPFPTKFISASKVKSELIHQKNLEAETGLLDIEIQAYQEFVDLNEVLARRQLVYEKQKFFEGHLKRLKAYTISNQVQQLHILEMEATLKEIEADLRALTGEERTLRLKLGAWISKGGEALSADPQLEPINLEKAIPVKDSSASPYLKLSQSNEALRDRQKSLAKQSWLPDLSLTYRRHVRHDNLMPNSHELMLGIELPFLFPGQPNAQAKQSDLFREEAFLQNEQQHREVYSQIEALRTQLEATRDQLKLMGSAILPNLDKRMHLLHRLAQTDMESLDLHRSIFEQLQAGQEKNLKLESTYRKTALALEALLGD